MKGVGWVYTSSLLLITTLFLSSCANSSADFTTLLDGTCSNEQKIAVTDHISAQIDALESSNFTKAYSFAATSFQEGISQERFEQIIINQYKMIINNDKYSFTSCEIGNEVIVQQVELSAKGLDYEFNYRLSFEDQRLGIVAATVIPSQQGVNT